MKATIGLAFVPVVSASLHLSIGAGASAAQEAFMVVGDVRSPPGLEVNQPLRPGTRVVVGPNGLVVIQQTWLVQDRLPCVSWVVVSASEHTVTDQRRGECPATGEPTALDRFRLGEAFVAHMVFLNVSPRAGPRPGATPQPRNPRERAEARLRQIASTLERASDQAERRVRERERAEAARLEETRRREAELRRQEERRAQEREDSLGRGGRARPSVAVGELTGTWVDRENQGIYYLRQEGDRVWWYGRGRDVRQWSHLFLGTRDGDVIVGEWLSLPPASSRSSGIVRIRVTPEDTLHVTDQTGGFEARILIPERR